MPGSVGARDFVTLGTPSPHPIPAEARLGRGAGGVDRSEGIVTAATLGCPLGHSRLGIVCSYSLLLSPLRLQEEPALCGSGARSEAEGMSIRGGENRLCLEAAGFPCHSRVPRDWAACGEPRRDAHLGPGIFLASPRKGATEEMPSCRSAPLWARQKLCRTGLGDDDSDGTATQSSDNRASLAPPRPVISPLLPARVNNSPGCQTQVTFVAAMKEPRRRRLIFGGQKEVWRIN